MKFSYSHCSDSNKPSWNEAKCLFDFAMGMFVPSPAIMIIYNLVLAEWLNTTFSLKLIRSEVFRVINSIEVVILLLVKVRQIPIQTNVLQGKIVPLVVVRIVWDFVVVDVLSSSENTFDFNQFSTVNLWWSSSFVLQVCWDPTSVDNDGAPVDFNRLVASKQFFEAGFTSFVAVKWINNIITWHAIIWMGFWNQYFLGVIKLA